MSSPSPSDNSFDREIRVQRRFIKRPDTKVRDDALAKLNADIKQRDTQLTEINAQLKKAVTDPKVNDSRKTLIAELGELKKTQATLKEKRNIINSKIKEIDSNLKRKVTEIQSITSKHSFKSADDIDKKIKRNEDEISSGALTLVDERRTVKEISALRKLRKDFAGLESLQTSIDADKAKISDLKQELSTLNSKEVSAKFEGVQKQLDELSLSNKSVNDKRNDLYNKRNALNKEKDVLYAEVKKIRAEFDESFKSFKKSLADEQKRVVDEEKKLKADKEKSERKSKLEKELADASRPAFEEEIDTIHTLLKYFDPSYIKPVKVVEFNKSTLTPSRTTRTVASLDDFEVIKREDTAFFAGSNQGKNGKKNKKVSKRFILDPELITSLGDLAITLPLSQDDVPATIASLQAKLQEFQTSQAETTKKNIESAKGKIAKLEADWAKQDAKEAEAAATAAQSSEATASEE